MPKTRTTAPLLAAYARMSRMLDELGTNGRHKLAKGTGIDALALQGTLELVPDAGLRLALRAAAYQLLAALDAASTPLPREPRIAAIPNMDPLPLDGIDAAASHTSGSVPVVREVGQIMHDLRSLDLASLPARDREALAATTRGITTVDDLIEVLESLDLTALPASQQERLSNAAAPVVRALANLHDSDVTRRLLDGLPASPALASVLFDTDASTLDPDAQLSFLQASQRLIGAVAARQDAGIVAFVGNNPHHTVYHVDGGEHALIDARAAELGLAMQWSDQFTRIHIAAARTIANELPVTRMASTAGTLQPVVCTAIAEGAHELTAHIDHVIDTAVLGKVDADQIAELRTMRRSMLTRYEAALLPYATGHSLTRVQSRIRVAISRIDPDGLETRRAVAARVRTGVELRHLPDGLSMLTAIMASEQAVACYKRIDERANVADEREPIGLRRASSLHSLLMGSMAEDAATLPVHLDLVMDLDAFLGLANTPAQLDGVGPLPAGTVRDLLCAAPLIRFRRIITDPATGHRLDAGVKRYQLTESERRHILERDRHCRFKDCNAPAVRCECDHAVPYEQGGPSRTANLGAVCKRHHQHKTHAGWKIIESGADGSCTWQSPLGRTYTHEPDPPLPWREPERHGPDEDATD